MNSSRDVNGNAHTFRTLGLFAAAGGSTSIASNDQNFSSGSVSASSTINGVITQVSQQQVKYKFSHEKVTHCRYCTFWKWNCRTFNWRLMDLISLQSIEPTI